MSSTLDSSSSNIMKRGAVSTHGPHISHEELRDGEMLSHAVPSDDVHEPASVRLANRRPEVLPETERNASQSREAWQAARAERTSKGLDWPIAAWLVIVHVGAIAAPFVFSWQAFATFMLLNWITGSLGICLGFHRLFTHRSFKTYKPMRWLIAWVGGLAGEGSAIHWVANHRKHHALSDRVGDPHSPHDGPWWSHAFWFLWARSKDDYRQYNQRWAPDLANDPAMIFLDKTFILWHVLLGLGLFALGYYCMGEGGAYMGWSMVVWGTFLRMVFVLHSTWLVNSASHIWGYRTYETTDDSRNNWWVALITFGEGWHNNHHAFPAMARAGHKWWEIDMTFWALRFLQVCGLAWDIVDGHHTAERKHKTKKIPTQPETVG